MKFFAVIFLVTLLVMAATVSSNRCLHAVSDSHFLITNSFMLLLIELPFCINVF